jgi:hypothetical protein
MNTIAGELRIGGTTFQAGDSLAAVQEAIDALEAELARLRELAGNESSGVPDDSPPRYDDFPEESRSEYDAPDVSQAAYEGGDPDAESPEDEHSHKAQRRKIATRQLKRGR